MKEKHIEHSNHFIVTIFHAFEEPTCTYYLRFNYVKPQWTALLLKLSYVRLLPKACLVYCVYMYVCVFVCVYQYRGKSIVVQWLYLPPLLSPDSLWRLLFQLPAIKGTIIMTVSRAG